MRFFFFKFIQFCLGRLAKSVIIKFHPFIIAVTGSVGKSSTKEAIYLVLKDYFGNIVAKNQGNLNTEIGLPLAILGQEKPSAKFLWPILILKTFWRVLRLKKYPKYLVLEFGVDKPGDMAYLTSIVPPDIAIITSLSAGAISTAHVENFKSLKDYQEEKIVITKNLKPKGRIIINGDDQLLARLEDENLISVGIENPKADYAAKIIDTSLLGLDYRISCAGHKLALKSALLGAHMVYSALFAMAVADILGLPLISAVKSIERLKALPGRMSLIEGKEETLIVDDTYNANPTSMKAALDFLAQIKYPHRRVVILGNMNELGRLEREAHREIGEYARDKCDFAIFVGPNAEAFAQGYDSKNFKVFSNKESLILALGDLIQKNDIILVKASQGGNFFEEIVKVLMKNPAQAPKYLVRQSREWMRIKSKKE